MICLGVDYGVKRVGLAKSDELGLMAYQLGCIVSKGSTQVISELEKVAHAERADLWVVGLPITTKGMESEQTKAVQRFVNKLRSMSSLPVVTWDERYTTALAERLMLERNLSRSKRKQKRDAAAAEIMLQSYLDHQKNM